MESFVAKLSEKEKQAICEAWNLAKSGVGETPFSEAISTNSNMKHIVSKINQTDEEER